jgi:glycogen(starch) synthase
MRIALISYEYPVDTPAGGIATYTKQAARLLQERGHEVEVFAASPRRDAVVDDEGVRVHLVRETSRYDFAVMAGHRFAARHAGAAFDVVEAPELYAESRKILELVPEMPLVVRMHTPNLTIWKLALPSRGFCQVAGDLLNQIRNLPWYWKRGHVLPDLRLVRPELAFAQHQDMIENACAAKADRVVALFPGMSTFLTDVWRIPKGRVVVVPNPFYPSPGLLEIPPGSHAETVSFIGRLEVRKGILDWVKAIPLVAKKHPQAKFRFVGASGLLPNGTEVTAYIRQQLAGLADRLEFTGAVSPERMPQEFAKTGIVVAPSLWENYPYTCLEAMAAGRAVVGSSAGGMAHMLAEGAGLLVKPRDAGGLARAVSDLLTDPGRQRSLGEVAREKVLRDHDSDRIGIAMEQVYAEAIQHRKQLGGRGVQG